jgi:hypothetical protein
MHALSPLPRGVAAGFGARRRSLSTIRQIAATMVKEALLNPPSRSTRNSQALGLVGARIM